MSWRAGLLMLSVLSGSAMAGDYPIVGCRATHGKWAAELTAFEQGRSQLSLNFENKKHLCILAVKKVSSYSKKGVPVTRFEFAKKRCSPEMTKADENEIIEFLTLKIEGSGARREGFLQWMRYEQPENCVVTRFDRESVEIARKSWELGAWPGKQ